MPAHPEEDARLLAVARLGLPDAGREPVFDGLAAAAAQVAGTPLAMLSVVDATHQWLTAKVGFDVDCVAREDTFCETVVRSGVECVVPDARLDPRFAGHPAVTGQPPVVAYAAFPLATDDDHVLGTLCVAGPERVDFTEAQIGALRSLAGQAVTQMELRASLRREAAASARLLAAEASWRDLVEFTSDVVISRHGLDGSVRYVSPSVANVLGTTPDEPLQVHPADLDDLSAAFAGVASGGSELLTVRGRHADGAWRHLDVRLTPRRDDSGAVVEVFSAARDVTDRVHAAEALRAERVAAEEARRFCATVLDTMPVGVVACDARGHLTMFNEAAKRLHGLAADPLISSADWASTYDLYQGDGVTQLAPDEVPLRRLLLGDDIDGATMVVARGDAPPVTLRCVGRRLCDAAGSPAGAVVAMVDVTAELASQRALLAAHGHMRAALDALPREIVLLSVDRDGDGDGDADSPGLSVAWANAAALTQASSSLAGMANQPFEDALPTWELRFGEVAVAVAADGRPRRVPVESYEGLALSRALDATVVPWADGGLLIDVEDVTDRRLAEHALAASRVRLEQAHDLAGIATWSWTPADDVVEWSARTYELFGVDAGVQPSLELMLDLVHRDDRNDFQSTYAAIIADHQPRTVDHRILLAGGSVRWVRAWASVETGLDGRVVRLYGSKQDITAQRAREQRYAVEAMRDALTGAANRRGWDALGGAALAHADAACQPVAVVVLDLDHFKLVNDRRGHAAGDALLRACVTAWHATLRRGDVLARLGGEEFAVLLPACDVLTGKRLVELLRAAVPAGATASAGLAMIGPGEGLAAALARADAALYAAKDQGRDRAVIAA